MTIGSGPTSYSSFLWGSFFRNEDNEDNVLNVDPKIHCIGWFEHPGFHRLAHEAEVDEVFPLPIPSCESHTDDEQSGSSNCNPGSTFGQRFNAWQNLRIRTWTQETCSDFWRHWQWLGFVLSAWKVMKGTLYTHKWMAKNTGIVWFWGEIPTARLPFSG